MTANEVVLAPASLTVDHNASITEKSLASQSVAYGRTVGSQAAAGSRSEE